MLVYRNDDVGYQADMDKLKRVHEIHQRYNVPHRMAVICRDLSKAKELISFINSDSLCDPQFHCYDHIRHINHYDKIREQFTNGIAEFEQAFSKRPTVWHPSWNEADAFCEQVANEFGMRVCNQKFSLDQHIRRPDVITEGVINYHFWHDPERHLLEPSMQLYLGL
jgi:hypothetical protein